MNLQVDRDAGAVLAQGIAARLWAAFTKDEKSLVRYIEGAVDSVPSIHETAEHRATKVQDSDDHDLSTCVRAVETEDYQHTEPLTVKP
jgi:hypothetical protein